MVVIRPTRKLWKALPVAQRVGPSDTALGDWYVNRLVVDRQPLLLLVSSLSLLPMLVRARDVRELPSHLEQMVGSRLERLRVAAPLIEAERRAMTPVGIGATVDRPVLGIMVDFAKGAPYYLEAGGWDDAALEVVEERLAKAPCFAGKSSDRVVIPEQKAPELLTARWAGAGSPEA